MALGIFVSFSNFKLCRFREGMYNIGGAISISLISAGVNSYLAIVISLIGGFLAGATQPSTQN